MRLAPTFCWQKRRFSAVVVYEARFERVPDVFRNHNLPRMKPIMCTMADTYGLIMESLTMSLPAVISVNATEPLQVATAPTDRISPIDTLRGMALFGVLIVNLVKEFRVSIFAQFVPSGPESPANRFLDSFVSYAFEMKAFALFSLLFGIGLGIQFDRLATRERPLYWLLRRLLVLLGFGLIHLLFIWNGDILTEYALAGMLVLPLLREDKETLAICSLGLFGFYVFMPSFHLPIYWPDSATLINLVESANRVYAQGTLVQVIGHNLGELKTIFPLHAFVFPRTLALFLFGMCIWRSGLPQNLRRHRRGLFIFGLIATVFGISLTLAVAMNAFSNVPMFGAYMSNLAPTVQALGYAALIAVAVQLPYLGQFLKIFAPLGRMAFTNYIVQSLVFGWIFFGYGLGQFGRMSVTAAFLLGVSVYIAQLIGSALWLRWFRFGPLEWLWRSLMYGRTQVIWKSSARVVE
jgi:uncharacterized protein